MPRRLFEAADTMRVLNSCGLQRRFTSTLALTGAACESRMRANSRRCPGDVNSRDARDLNRLSLDCLLIYLLRKFVDDFVWESDVNREFAFASRRAALRTDVS